MTTSRKTRTGDFIAHFDAEVPYFEQVFEVFDSENVNDVQTIAKRFVLEEPIYYGRMPRDLSIAFNSMRSAYLTFKGLLRFHNNRSHYERQDAPAEVHTEAQG